MPATCTPLRYPGGKTKLYPEIKPLLQTGVDITYIEPFAGGAGLALKLLFCQDVHSIVLNDIDENIYLFWRCCLDHTEELCGLVRGAELSIREWDRQREILNNPHDYSDLARAFALLYLNRCNRSGIVKGGPIGGRKQEGAYTIGARFNKETLIKKIRAIGAKSEFISVFCMDGKHFLDEYCSKQSVNSTFINIDPPYVNKGPELYRNAFTEQDHTDLSYSIRKLQQNWVVTYDKNELIRKLYSGFNMKEITLGYSAGNTRKSGTEYIITNLIQ